MAELYLARQSGMEGFEKTVAVKRLLGELARDPETVRMFLTEARIAAQLTHPNIAQIYDLGKAGDDYFIAMEYVPGRDMRAVQNNAIAQNRPIPLGVAVFVAICVCRGLHRAHTLLDKDGAPLGLVHRDVSPQNVMMTFNGDVKLVDFGIAKLTQSAAQTQGGLLKGKYAYMSPEQCDGEDLDARSDLFSTGILLYELVCGERLFRRDTDYATICAVIEEPIVPPSALVEDVPQDLEQIMMRALSRDRDQRPQSAEQLQLELEAAARDLGLTAGLVAAADYMQVLFANSLEAGKYDAAAYPDELVLDEPTEMTPSGPPTAATENTQRTPSGPPLAAVKTQQTQHTLSGAELRDAEPGSSAMPSVPTAAVLFGAGEDDAEFPSDEPTAHSLADLPLPSTEAPTGRFPAGDEGPLEAPTGRFPADEGPIEAPTGRFLGATDDGPTDDGPTYVGPTGVGPTDDRPTDEYPAVRATLSAPLRALDTDEEDAPSEDFDDQTVQDLPAVDGPVDGPIASPTPTGTPMLEWRHGDDDDESESSKALDGTPEPADRVPGDRVPGDSRAEQPTPTAVPFAQPSPTPFEQVAARHGAAGPEANKGTQELGMLGDELLLDRARQPQRTVWPLVLGLALALAAVTTIVLMLI